MKARSWKIRKIGIFPKGLTHDLGIKMEIFPTFFFLGKIGQKNVFYDILERIKAFPGYENKKLKQARNWHFSKGVNPWFWYQNGHISKLFFLGKIGQKIVFYDILERINAFPGYESKTLKKSKNWHFFQTG